MASSVKDILNSGPVPLARVRDYARRTLVALLDASPGRKTLVIEPAIATWLGLMAEVPLLKEHGVDQLLLLGENGAPRLSSPPPSSASSASSTDGAAAVVFVARARPASAAAIAACVVAASSSSSSSNISGALSSSSKKQQAAAAGSHRPREFRALFAPRVTDAVRAALAAGGALGSVSLSPLRVHFLPVEPDVLSLEDPGAFADATRLGCGYGGEGGRLGRAAAAGGDPRPARDFAAGLVALARSNALLGVPKVVRGVGPAASVVRAALDLARRGADAEVADADEEREARRAAANGGGDDGEDDDDDGDENDGNGSPFPVPGTGRITEWLVIDRIADPVTPLATQLTYEGLVRETVEVRSGAAFVAPEPNAEGEASAAAASSPASPTSSAAAAAAAQPTRVPLSAGDPVFRDLRDASFAAAGPSLGARAKEIQQGYQAARGGGGGNNPSSSGSSASSAASLSELRALAGSLKALPSIQRHVALAEAVGAAVASPLFRERVEAEQRLLTLTGIQGGSGGAGGAVASSILGAVVGVGGEGIGGGGAASAAAAAAAERAVDAAEALLIRDGSPRSVDSALRLLCLATVAAGGIPKKRWESCRREVLLTAGPEAAAALVALERAGLLRCAGGVSGVVSSSSSSSSSALPPPMPPAVLPPAAFAALRRYLRLVADPGEDPRSPRDASFVHAGFCPISARLASAAAAASSSSLSSSPSSSRSSSSSSSNRSWAHLPGMAESLRALPQPCFEVELGSAADGSPAEMPLVPSSSPSTAAAAASNVAPRGAPGPPPAPSSSPRRILVCFVGGCTHAEVSALRWLSSSAAGRASVAALGSGGGSGGGGTKAAAAAETPSSLSPAAAAAAAAPPPEFEFVIATSAMLTGDELIRSFDPPAVAGLRATVAAV